MKRYSTSPVFRKTENENGKRPFRNLPVKQNLESLTVLSSGNQLDKPGPVGAAVGRDMVSNTRWTP